MKIKFQHTFHGLGRSIKAFTWMLILVLSISQKLLAQPFISEQPSDAQVCPGSNATFKVEALGVVPLTFQWQVDDGGGLTDISGETGNILLVSGADGSMDGNKYQCIVTDVNGTTYSSPALLTVEDITAPILTGVLPGGAQGNVCMAAAPAAPGEAAIAALYSDNCGIITATLMGSAVVGTDCGWTATYTYSIEDECGNLAPDAVVVYTGADTQAPILTGVLPGGAQGNVCMAAAPAAPGEAAIAALYSDNCGIITATLMGSTVVGTDCGWTATYTYSIEDECGNLAPDAVVVYTGADTQAPILTGVLPGGAQGNVCMAAAPAAPGEAAIAALYSDNCGSVTATLMGSAVVGTDCGWTATYTYSIEDECGNLAPDAVVVYTGADTQAPILTGVLPGGAQGNVCMAAAPAAPGEAAIAALYSDNCGSITATLMGSAVVGTDCGWTATYTYSIEDECGNLAPDAVVVYTGADTQAPILTGVLPGERRGMYVWQQPRQHRERQPLRRCIAITAGASRRPLWVQPLWAPIAAGRPPIPIA